MLTTGLCTTAGSALESREMHVLCFRPGYLRKHFISMHNNDNRLDLPVNMHFPEDLPSKFSFAPLPYASSDCHIAVECCYSPFIDPECRMIQSVRIYTSGFSSR